MITPVSVAMPKQAMATDDLVVAPAPLELTGEETE